MSGRELAGEDIVDLTRYPIDGPNSPEGRRLITTCARRFVEDGVVTLPGFLHPDAVRSIAAEATMLVERAFFCRSEHNVYLDAGDPSLPADHARNRSLTTSVGSIANDLLADDGVLQRLYDSPALTAFVGGVLGLKSLFRTEDPLGAVSVNVYNEGDAHAWHFDESRFSVTIMIQEPDDGGRFEYVRGLREGLGAPDDAGVGRVLDGDTPQVRQLDFPAGTLSIFGGRDTLHRVTPIAGATARLVPVLTYDTAPGAVNSPEVQRLFWGRTS